MVRLELFVSSFKMLKLLTWVSDKLGQKTVQGSKNSLKNTDSSFKLDHLIQNKVVFVHILRSNLTVPISKETTDYLWSGYPPKVKRVSHDQLDKADDFFFSKDGFSCLLLRPKKFKVNEPVDRSAPSKHSIHYLLVPKVIVTHCRCIKKKKKTSRSSKEVLT